MSEILFLQALPAARYRERLGRVLLLTPCPVTESNIIAK